MAYDEALAARVRDLLDGVAEKRMFGGLAFLLDGNLAVVVSSQGGLLLRLGPDADAALEEPHTAPMEMRGRPMTGWVRVAAEGVRGGELEWWVRRAVAFTRTLPAK